MESPLNVATAARADVRKLGSRLSSPPAPIGGVNRIPLFMRQLSDAQRRSELRMLAMPVGFPLISATGAHQKRLIQMSRYQLECHGRTRAREAGWQRNRWTPGHAERRSKAQQC